MMVHNKYFLRVLLFQLTPTQTILITLWALTMVFLPIADWSLGWEVMLDAVNMAVLVQASAVIAILWGAWGFVTTLKVAALVILLGWGAEALGSRTGIPFGFYSYTDALQPQFFHVPLLISFAWLMMLPPSWGVAQVVSSRLDLRWQQIAFILFSALAMTAWDFFLDPQMVAWGLWEWQTPSGYFGIPWSNYLGWLLVSALITLIIRPRNLPTPPLLLVYTITWLLQTVGLGIFWAMPGPAMVGGVIMGCLTVWGWRAHLNAS